MLDRLLRRLRRPASTEPAAEAAARERYAGYELEARPQREGDLWRVGGRIGRPDEPDGPHHDFIRVDTMASRDEAVRLSLMKARQLVDERGDTLLPAGDEPGEP